VAADAAAAQGVDAGCGAGRGLRLHHQLLQATAACAARARTPSGQQERKARQTSCCTKALATHRRLRRPFTIAVAFAKFNGASLKGKKEDLIKGLQSLISKQPSVLNLGALPALAAAASATPAIVVAVDGKLI